MTTPQVPWKSTPTLTYGAYGGRQVLIIFSDAPLPHPETVPRRESRLTEEDREKLQSENVPGKLEDEVAIVRKRYELDKAKKVFNVLESKPDKLLSRGEAFGVIAALMNNTENDGGMMYT
jgi:hypothetical protein